LLQLVHRRRAGRIERNVWHTLDRQICQHVEHSKRERSSERGVMQSKIEESRIRGRPIADLNEILQVLATSRYSQGEVAQRSNLGYPTPVVASCECAKHPRSWER